ncbi:MAG: endosialidase [Lachnospiraceae bacterium]|nr:endosialidase [Lachnospiraceae bacterium]
MSVVSELIIKEDDGSLGFGDYTLENKSKKSDFPYEGDLYKVKTFKEITKLEKNGLFVYESDPGTVVHEFKADADRVSFKVEGYTDAQITLELEPECEYNIKVGDSSSSMKTNLGGKLTFSATLDEGVPVPVEVKKA